MGGWGCDVGEMEELSMSLLAHIVRMHLLLPLPTITLFGVSVIAQSLTLSPILEGVLPLPPGGALRPFSLYTLGGWPLRILLCLARSWVLDGTLA